MSHEESQVSPRLCESPLEFCQNACAPGGWVADSKGVEICWRLLQDFTRPVFLRKGTWSWQTILIHLSYLNKFDVVLMVVRHVISAPANLEELGRKYDAFPTNKAPKSTTCDSKSREHEELKLFSSAVPSSAASQLSIQLHTAPTPNRSSLWLILYRWTKHTMLQAFECFRLWP